MKVLIFIKQLQDSSISLPKSLRFYKSEPKSFMMLDPTVYYFCHRCLLHLNTIRWPILGRIAAWHNYRLELNDVFIEQRWWKAIYCSHHIVRSPMTVESGLTWTYRFWSRLNPCFVHSFVLISSQHIVLYEGLIKKPSS